MGVRKTKINGKKGSVSENTVFTRPDCEVCGLEHGAAFNSTFGAGGVPYFRRIEQNNGCGNEGKLACRGCLKTSRIGANKLYALGSDSQTGGFRLHRFYTKDYCENVDGRLGFTCTTSKPPGLTPSQLLGMFDVDHVDEDHYNNHPSNLQTFCASCHRYKTFVERSHTPEHVAVIANMLKKHSESLVTSLWYQKAEEHYTQFLASVDAKQQAKRKAG